MPQPLLHDLKIPHRRDAVARQDFVVGLRRYVLNDLASVMREEYEEKVAPAIASKQGDKPLNQDIIHSEMRHNTIFQFYSAARYNAQEMSWRSVIPEVARHRGDIASSAEKVTADPIGSLTLDPSVDVPENVKDLDVHLMPGGYVSDDPLLAGAIYDNGLTVFTAGMIGPKIDDIGQSFANYIKLRFPDLKPSKILDCGCTIGHHTVPWAQCYPEAEVHGIDVSGSVLGYGHARAESLGVPIHFHQMDATEMSFADGSMDIIFSSQFLHELSLKDIGKFFKEAYRVLKPGGLLVTMELPPNRFLEPYDQFYLDWDCYYNREPFYRAFRDADLESLVKPSGFDFQTYFHFTVPQYFKTPEAEFESWVNNETDFNGDTGRLSDAIKYFGFGLWK